MRSIRRFSLQILMLGTIPTVFAQLPPVKVTSFQPGQGSQSVAACSAMEASSCTEAASKLVPLIMGDSPMIENLRRLTDEIGGRVTGSPEMAQAVQWGIAGFRAAGVVVHTEKYTLPVTWKEGVTRLTILTPAVYSIQLQAVSEGFGPATPVGGIEAAVVDIADGSDADFARAGNIKNAILLAHSEIGSTWADLFNEYMRPPTIISRAGGRGCTFGPPRERLLSPPIRWLGETSNSGSPRSAGLVPRLLKTGETATQCWRPIEQKRSEKSGYERPDEVVIGHLDSWELGTGALDNG
jgi:hypothetical protein